MGVSIYLETLYLKYNLQDGIILANLSPMMQQYLSIKEAHKDHIVFFRLGDFYEMFFDDALLASKELELTLTGRDCGLPERAPMCGIPYHSSEAYIQRLLEKGYKVAICEQTEDPALAKGLVKREVVRMITPGTVMDSSMLDENVNSFILRNSNAVAFFFKLKSEAVVILINSAARSVCVRNFKKVMLGSVSVTPDIEVFRLLSFVSIRFLYNRLLHRPLEATRSKFGGIRNVSGLVD